MQYNIIPVVPVNRSRILAISEHLGSRVARHRQSFLQPLRVRRREQVIPGHVEQGGEAEEEQDQGTAFSQRAVSGTGRGAAAAAALGQVVEPHILYVRGYHCTTTSGSTWFWCQKGVILQVPLCILGVKRVTLFKHLYMFLVSEGCHCSSTSTCSWCQKGVIVQISLHVPGVRRVSLFKYLYMFLVSEGCHCSRASTCSWCQKSVIVQVPSQFLVSKSCHCSSISTYSWCQKGVIVQVPLHVLSVNRVSLFKRLRVCLVSHFVCLFVWFLNVLVNY